MAYKRELTKTEQDERRKRRLELMKKYPGGIAEIEAIWDKKEPFKENPTIRDRMKPRATSTPAIPLYTETGGTHPVSGLPEVKSIRQDIPIWPVSGRTDRAGALTRYYKPVGLLEILDSGEMGCANPTEGRPHPNPIYRLKAVPQKELEAEKKALTDPDSRANFEAYMSGGKLQHNIAASEEKGLGLKGVVNTEKYAVEGIGDGFDQFTEEELADTGELMPNTNAEE